MKKLLTLILSLVVAVGVCVAFAACDDTNTSGETVTITCLDGSAQEIEKEVPKNPQRVAILDYAVLDIMDLLNVGDRVVSSAEGTIDYLQTYWDKIDSGDIVNLGNLKSYDMEKIQNSEPDIIFIGGRQSAKYAELEEIAPVVYLAASYGSVYDDTIANAKTIAKIFDIAESKVDEIASGYQTRIDAIKAVSADKNALVLMYTSESSISAIGANGRCSLISNELGFTNISTSSASNDTHGDSVTWETLLNADPDYVFVLNRGMTTGDTGNEQVIEVMNNKITNSMKAHQSGHLVILEHSDAWYTAEGGLNALNYMIKDMESIVNAG